MRSRRQPDYLARISHCPSSLMLWRRGASGAKIVATICRMDFDIEYALAVHHAGVMLRPRDDPRKMDRELFQRRFA